MKKLGFGTMRLPLTDPEDPAAIDMEAACRMADLFLERGFTYFDTAYMYHKYESERAVKRMLADRYPRERYLLADKLPLSHLKEAGQMETIFAEQLEKCGVEYFDYYLLHCVNTELYERAERFDAFSFAVRLKAEGKAKRIGFSYHDSAELLEQILKAHPEMEFVQLQLNYLDWDSPNIQSRLCLEVCKKYGKPVIVMEPVKGGTLAKVPAEAEEKMRRYAPDRSPASWAVRFAASQENVVMVLSGMSDEAQLQDNMAYMQDFEPLNGEELRILGEVTDIINANTAIPCTGCRYCVEGCPKQIPIPEYFTLYNQYELFGSKSNSGAYYDNYRGKAGLASDCIGCGQCERACPQHLPVSEYLKQVAERFEKPKS